MTEVNLSFNVQSIAFSIGCVATPMVGKRADFSTAGLFRRSLISQALIIDKLIHRAAGC